MVDFCPCIFAIPCDHGSTILEAFAVSCKDAHDEKKASDVR